MEKINCFFHHVEKNNAGHNYAVTTQVTKDIYKKYAGYSRMSSGILFV